MSQQVVAQLRAELQDLKARYDYHFSPEIFAVVRRLELEIAWLEHRR